MKFLNNINLTDASDVLGKGIQGIQDTSDTLELTMAVLLNKLFGNINEFNPNTATSGPANNVPVDAAKWYETAQDSRHTKLSTSRQDFLNTCGTYATEAFTDYNTYRNTLLAINPDVVANMGEGVPFPGIFTLMQSLSTKALTKTAARELSTNHKIIYGPTSVKVKEGIEDITRTYTGYETYIKQPGGSLIYYRWKKIESDDVSTGTVNGTTTPIVPNDVVIGSNITVTLPNEGVAFWSVGDPVQLHVDSNNDEILDSGEPWLIGTISNISRTTNGFPITTTLVVSVASKSTSTTPITNWIVGYRGVTYVDYCYTGD